MLTNLALSALLLLTACAPSLPMTKTHPIAVPPSFPTADSGNVAADIVWKDFFHDPQLNALINISLKHNQELQIVEQDIYLANNEIMSRQGEFLPKFNLTAGGGVEKVERFSSEDANSVTKFGRAGAMASWEIDIWKKLRNATKSAYYEFLASVDGRNFLMTNLVAEVANTYFELLALDNQLDIVNSYIEILEKVRRFVQLQQQAGRVTALPVKRFEAEVLKNQSRKFEILQQITQAQNKLNMLMGRFPQRIERDAKKFSEFKLAHIKSGIPVKALENRPDVKRAANELEAAKLNVEVARARFYPALSIDGELGYERFNSKHFRDPVTDPFYALTANLTAPILNRKAIKADYFSSNNKQIQAVYEYEKTLIAAYTDVVNQLNTIKNYDAAYAIKVKQVQALNESIEISNTLFKAARVDYVESLLTQRDALEAQVELVEVKKQQLAAYVNLYKALGGGWKGSAKDVESNY